MRARDHYMYCLVDGMINHDVVILRWTVGKKSTSVVRRCLLPLTLIIVT